MKKKFFIAGIIFLLLGYWGLVCFRTHNLFFPQRGLIRETYVLGVKKASIADIQPLDQFFYQEHLTIYWHGYIHFPVSGKYRFQVFANDFAQVTVHGSVVATCSFPESVDPCLGPETFFAAGSYPISVQYHNEKGIGPCGAEIRLEWIRPDAHGVAQVVPIRQLHTLRGDRP
jgi:hypothetical protein